MGHMSHVCKISLFSSSSFLISGEESNRRMCFNGAYPIYSWGRSIVSESPRISSNIVYRTALAKKKIEEIQTRNYINQKHFVSSEM